MVIHISSYPPSDTIRILHDEQLVGDSSANGMTSLKMVFDIPVENAKTRGLGYGPDQEATEQERVISDIYAIAFDKDGKCVDKFYTTYESGILTATVNLDRTASGEEITVMVLTNLENLENGEALVGSLDGMIGKSKEEVLKALEYNFSGAWEGFPHANFRCGVKHKSLP